MGRYTMLEPNSEEEIEFLRYLLKKYIPGLKSQGKEMPTIMFNQNDFDDEEK
jgi:hypothetical protein